MSSSTLTRPPAWALAPLGRDLACGGCGYGIVARGHLPERCPMCGGFDWRELGRRSGGAQQGYGRLHRTEL